MTQNEMPREVTKEKIKIITTIMISIENDLSFIKTKGVSAETPELFTELVLIHKKKFEETLPVKNMVDMERRIFYPMQKFFSSVRENMTVMEVMTSYLFFQKIVERYYKK